MEEKGVALFCVLVAVLGIASLFFISSSLAPQEKAIPEISAADEGTQVMTSGTVASARHTNGNYFFKLCGGSACIEVPVFSSLAAKLAERGVDLGSIQKGDYVEVAGRVGEYDGALQVVPSEGGFDVIRQ